MEGEPYGEEILWLEAGEYLSLDDNSESPTVDDNNQNPTGDDNSESLLKR